MGELPGNIPRKFADVDLERTQAVESYYAERGIDRDEHPRHIAPVVLTGSAPEPVIQGWMSAGEFRTVVVIGERFEQDRQSLSRQFAVPAKSGDKSFGWLRRASQSIQKRVPVSTGKNHAFMLGEHSASPLVCKVAG